MANWEYMERYMSKLETQYMQELESKRIEELDVLRELLKYAFHERSHKSGNESLDINVSNWKEIKISDVLGNASLGRYHNPQDLKPDKNGYPFICASNANNGINRKMPLRQHEEICVFYREVPTYNPQMTIGEPLHSRGSLKGAKNSSNYGHHKQVDMRAGSTEKFPTSIIEMQKVHPSKCIQPTEKPVKLMEWLIKTYTLPGETVLDFAMGSGTTMIACHNTGRNGIGIELDNGYFDIAEKRIKEHTAQERLFF